MMYDDVKCFRMGKLVSYFATTGTCFLCIIFIIVVLSVSRSADRSSASQHGYYPEQNFPLCTGVFSLLESR